MEWKVQTNFCILFNVTNNIKHLTTIICFFGFVHLLRLFFLCLSATVPLGFYTKERNFLYTLTLQITPMDVSVVLGFVRCVVSMVIIGCYVVAPTILSCFLINGSESQSLEKRFGTEIVCFFGINLDLLRRLRQSIQNGLELSKLRLITAILIQRYIKTLNDNH